MKSKRLLDLTQISVLAAIICVCSPWIIPIGPVPITLATFSVYLVSYSAGKKKGTLAVLLFILLGAVGVPVFSGFAGGVHKIIGITGGYIIGYIPCAFVVGAFSDKFGISYPACGASMLIGTVLCYTVGTAWYIFQTDAALEAALVSCVVPFIATDLAKIFTACVTLNLLKKSKAYEKIFT